jgi:peptidoglycan/LPS O-acetylase OafA/YrhL
MVAIGAIVVLAVDVLGDIILEEYSIGSVAWVLALLVLITIAAHRWGDLNLFGNYGRALMVLGVLGGALAAREIFDDARFDYLDGGTKTLFAVLYSVAGALMLVGAWQFWSGETDEDGN